MKIKNYLDEECEVIGYTKGNGKFKNLLGVLFCKLETDKIIRKGNGFTNGERIYFPNIDAII